MMKRRRSLGLAASMIMVSALSLVNSSPALAATHIVQDNWDLFYSATSSDGVRIETASFKGFFVFGSGMTIPQIRVFYPDGSILDDQLGSGGTAGSPIPLVSLDKVNITSGFKIVAVYQMVGWPNACTYKYTQRYTFLSSGEIRIHLEAFGPGCSTTHHYHVNWRLDFDIEGAGGDFFWHNLSGTNWETPAQEGSFPDDGLNDPQGFEWVNFEGSTGRAFWLNPTSADNANFYILKFNSGEGGADLAAITTPDTFVNGEAVQNTNNVDWYIGRQSFTRPTGCPPTCDTPITEGVNAFAAGF